MEFSYVKGVDHFFGGMFTRQALILRPRCRKLESFMYSVPRHFTSNRKRIVCGKHGRLEGVAYSKLSLIIGSFHHPGFVGQFICNVFHPSGTVHSCSRTELCITVKIKAPCRINCLGIHEKLLLSHDCCIALTSAYPRMCGSLFCRRFSCTSRILHTMKQIATILRRRKCTRGSCKENGVLFRGAPSKVGLRVISLGHVCMNPVSVREKYGGFRHLPTAPRVRHLVTRRCTTTHNFSTRGYFRLVRTFQDARPKGVSSLCWKNFKVGVVTMIIACGHLRLLGQGVSYLERGGPLSSVIIIGGKDASKAKR